MTRVFKSSENWAEGDILPDRIWSQLILTPDLDYNYILKPEYVSKAEQHE
jgi:hypothetical protein